MRWSSAFGLIALLHSCSASTLAPLDHDRYDYYAIHLTPSTSPDEVAVSLGLTHEGQLGELQHHHIFSSPPHPDNLVNNALQELRRRRRKRSAEAEYHILDGISFAQKQRLKPRLEKRGVIPADAERMVPPAKRPPPYPVDSSVLKQQQIAAALGIQDPIFAEQWHLFNPVQLGHDVNVTDVWKQGITGQGATVAIVDDGLDMYSDDLKDNYFAEGSYDFNDNGLEPKPRLSDDRHGTRCAGEIAAVKNNVCGVGVAWDAKVAGIRILSKKITDADEAVALNYAYQKNQIYSCSWGPPDDGISMDAPGILIKRAIVNGVQNGRHGKGSIFVFASGNGASKGDNCNFDGYTNSIYSITVGAIDRKGLHPFYSEECSAQLVVTYSSGSGDAIHTTDVGTNACYSMHGGTSAAAPLAAGIFSLVLSVRPDLTWRDLQYLSLQTAVPINEVDGDWQETSIGKRFSHKYGYGKLDAYAIVEAAKSFKSVKPQAWHKSPWMHVKKEIPQGAQGLASTVTISKEQTAAANLERLEHVTVTINVAHSRRGDLSVELRSPAGVVSHLSVARSKDSAPSGYIDWTFMSVAHWGENGVGDWTVIVKDTEVNEHKGTFIDWQLDLWGEALDASKATLLPMPTEHDDDDHDKEVISVPATTVSIDPGAQPTAPVDPAHTDHPDRPVNMKPTDAATVPSVPSPTASGTPSSTATSNPGKSFLPSFFPTFGVSKRTQVWIYGAVTIIVLFCAGLGTYFYLARRKRLRNNPRDEYEFEVLDDAEDEQAMLRGEKRGNRRRAGDLYDAFAGETDEEVFSEDEDEDGDDSGDEGQPYRDGDDREPLNRSAAPSAGAGALSEKT